MCWRAVGTVVGKYRFADPSKGDFVADERGFRGDGLGAVCGQSA